MKFSLTALTYLACMTRMPTSTMAMMANPEPFEVAQPDGTKVTVRLNGDEHYHDMTDVEDYTIVKNVEGQYVYANLDPQGDIVPTALLVGKANPKASHIPRHVKPTNGQTEKHRHGRRGGTHANTHMRAKEHREHHPGRHLTVDSHDDQHHRRTMQTTGTLKNVVLLIRFADHVNRELPTAAGISELMNAGKGQFTNIVPTGSVKHHYLEYSYDKLNIESTVFDWVTVSRTELFVANGSSGINTRLHDVIREALGVIQTRDNVNFGSFDDDSDGFIDGFTVFHSSYSAETGQVDPNGLEFPDRIWSHRWNLNQAWVSSDNTRVSAYNVNPALWSVSGSEIGRVGVVAHELGHFIGLPDLYDPEPADAPPEDRGRGIGIFGLMADAWGIDGSQRFPPHMSAWSKVQMGWVDAMRPMEGINSVAATQIKTNQPQVYKIGDGEGGYPQGEYLLIENRQPTGTDKLLPQGGIYIWHIDDQASFTKQGYPGQSGWPANGNHYRVALLPADGRYDLEQNRNGGDSTDPFHAGGVAQLGPSQGNALTGPFPNTDRYQGGNVARTGNVISNISASGTTMTFRCTGPGCQAAATQPTSSPTKAPTSAPTSNPTMKPTPSNENDGTGNGECNSNESQFDLRLVTDNFGDETSWQIINDDGTIVKTGSGYENNKVNLIKECIPKNDCYTFVINDTWGDGICCGQGIGSYTVSLDGTFVAVGGEFGLTDSSGQFGAACGAPGPSPTSSPTKAPTGAPTKQPSRPPTKSPTLAPTKAPVDDGNPNGCSSSQQTVRIELSTDNFGDETSWKILDNNDAELHTNTQAYPNNSNGIVETRCIPKDGCFSFQINDSFGDGMCCGEGSGSYRVTVDGSQVAAGGEFTSQDSTVFGNQCNEPTPPPTEGDNNANSCGNNQAELRVVMQTDNFGDETSWSLARNSDGTTIQIGGPYPNNSPVEEKRCVPANVCYKFTMMDSFGDGMCCNEGQGSYEVFWDSVSMNKGGDFGEDESFLLGNCNAGRRRVAGTDEAAAAVRTADSARHVRLGRNDRPAGQGTDGRSHRRRHHRQV